MIGSRSVASIVSAIALATGATMLTSCSRTPEPPAVDYAVYAEYSLTSKPMVAGWNTRVFNKREVEEGTHISLDDQTGVVTLKPGRYRVTALSLVNYADPANPTVIPTVPAPPAGYARLRYLKDALAPDTVPTPDVINASNAKALSVGTGSDANALPSFMDTFLNVTDEAKLVVEHQVGEDVKGLYLQVNENDSVWHINARITIQRVA
ncbi:hypothetical protein FHT40_003487 [Mycolicibacterium sp. BK556]|uniref:hypothetical protein n=1 Tax=Mycobacteriaceae TaxID=1762 RepID=UPI00105C3051|nr:MULTISPECIES: hypothetical protein [Mycobacteriaceae]MBB3603826.1 hypothetical protein [Mycolicibacterium sp. BK556]MBB3634021.1 hypothetical protein [Mycolicibacterium sp. BK607]MBB3751602.1 hypothetical protein [Mycolicibacterium sp. BK634]